MTAKQSDKTKRAEREAGATGPSATGPSATGPSATGRGGKRAGAGRPKNSGTYREPTAALRVPQSLLPVIKNLLAAKTSQAAVAELALPALTPPPQALPLYTSDVAAGLPSPADDHIGDVLDLNQLLVQRPAQSYCVRVSGDSMTDAGIHSGDVLIVEHSEQARHGQIVIAAVNGELTVKRYYINEGAVRLVAENPAYPAIEITEAMDFRLWGVVTGLVRQFR